MIVKAIVSLAEILACNTIAEGVENESQEQFLKKLAASTFRDMYYRPGSGRNAHAVKPLICQQIRWSLNGC
jgi:EAL domain-containing protein (putative c-di-GMP-specific phosphodiesterase class I)